MVSFPSFLAKSDDAFFSRIKRCLFCYLVAFSTRTTYFSFQQFVCQDVWIFSTQWEFDCLLDNIFSIYVFSEM